MSGKNKAVPLAHPSGRTSSTGSNAPTKTQANVTSKGVTRVGSPIDTAGAHGGHAVGRK